MKTLKYLLKPLKHIRLSGPADWRVTSIEFDSRKIAAAVQPGESRMFVALRGTQTDGHKFIPQAVAAGARVIVCEELPEAPDPDITFVQVDDSAEALGQLAAAFYGNPDKKLKLVGITGTNGKTTTVTLLHRLFRNMGIGAGLLSTIVNRVNDEEFPAMHTTPDAVETNRLLALMAEKGCKYCFMEVSSHAICQKRIAGLHFAGGVFSNITHDHLDFHKTFANYITAKKAFFDSLPKTAFALTNADDRNGMVMVQNSKAKVCTYSLLTDAVFKGMVLDDSFQGLQMRIDGREVFFRLCGKFNAYNLLAIYGVAVLLGVASDEALTQMSRLESAPGRFSILHRSDGAAAIVDYAHTPDALENVLSTICGITRGKAEVLTVTGCGGDRDALKRPEMAAIACRYSHKVILTSDNPRTERPSDILDNMLAGVPEDRKKSVVVIENRREAIRTACMMLTAGGVLLVAGKGHETYQEINGVRHHFDDSEEIRNCFRNQ